MIEVLYFTMFKAEDIVMAVYRHNPWQYVERRLAEHRRVRERLAEIEFAILGVPSVCRAIERQGEMVHVKRLHTQLTELENELIELSVDWPSLTAETRRLLRLAYVVVETSKLKLSSQPTPAQRLIAEQTATFFNCIMRAIDPAGVFTRQL